MSLTALAFSGEQRPFGLISACLTLDGIGGEKAFSKSSIRQSTNWQLMQLSKRRSAVESIQYPLWETESERLPEYAKVSEKLE